MTLRAAIMLGLAPGLLALLALCEPEAAIRICANGSVYPPNAPVRCSNLVCSLVGNLSVAGDGIVVERSGVVLEGGGRELRGSGAGTGVLILAENVTVRRLVVSGFEVGIAARNAANCIIEGNAVQGGRVGVGIWGSPACVVKRNAVEGSMVGIFVEDSSGASLLYNNMVRCGLYMRRSYSNVVEGNLVNGKPIAYLENASGSFAAMGYGQVLLLRCRKLVVEAPNASNTTVGVLVSESEGISVVNASLENNVVGVDVWNSSSVRVAGFKILRGEVGARIIRSKSIDVVSGLINSSSYGIYVESSAEVRIWRAFAEGCLQAAVALRDSRDCAVEESIITGSTRGISLQRISGTSIARNAIWRNGLGVVVNASASNLFTGNEFVENGVDVRLEGAGENRWDRNFWEKLWEQIKAGVAGSVALGEGNVDANPRQEPSIILPISVSSPLGVASGAGWYLNGSTAVVSVWPTSFIIVEFSRWVDASGRTVADEPKATITVTKPLELHAEWRVNLPAVAAAVALLSALLTVHALKRKKFNNNLEK